MYYCFLKLLGYTEKVEHIEDIAMFVMFFMGIIGYLQSPPKKKFQKECDDWARIAVDLHDLQNIKNQNPYVKIFFGKDKKDMDRVVFDLSDDYNNWQIISDIERKNFICEYTIGEEVDIERFLKEVYQKLDENHC